MMILVSWFKVMVHLAGKRSLIVLIVLIAFLLRINGLDFGLPYIFHDDEHQYVDAGIAFLQGKDAALAEIQKLNNPPLFKMVLGGVYSLYAHLLLSRPGEMQVAINTQLWRTFFHYLGRFASMSAGLLTVALLYALGKRLYGRKTGLIAALVLAISFLHVRESHFAVNDAPLTLLVVGSMYVGVGILRYRRRVDYLVTGFVIGLATATKYTGMYLIAVLVVAHFLGGRGGRHRVNPRWRSLFLSPRLWLGCLMVPVGFAIGAFPALIFWPEMLRRMAKLQDYGQFGYHDLLLAPHGGWMFYLQALAWGTGFLMFAAILAALAATLFYRFREDLMLAVFPLFLYGVMGSQKMVFVRFILPALPPLVLLLAAWIERVSRSRWVRGLEVNPGPLVNVGVGLLVLQPLAMSAWLGVVLNRPDTREMLADWVKANIPQGSAIYAEDQALPRYSVTGRVSLPYVQLEELDFDYPDRLDYYQDRGVQFIIASNYHHERKYADSGKEAGRQKWIAELSKQLLIKEFQPYWLSSHRFSFDVRYGPWEETLQRLYPGPVIRVYALRPNLGWHSLDPFIKSNQLLDKASLFGYEIVPEQDVSSESVVEASVYWLRDNWQAADDLFLSLIDSEGFEITRASAEPAPQFDGGRVLKSEARLQLPLGTPPGTYRIGWGVYDQQQRRELASHTIEQSQIRLTGPMLMADTQGKVTFAPGISLVSFDLLSSDDMMKDTLVLGQDNWLVLLWRSDGEIDEDYKIQLTLFDPQRNAVAVWKGEPVHNSYATSNWQSGQLIRDPWNLGLSETVENVVLDRPYYLELSMLDANNHVVSSKRLGTLMVSDRVRSSVVPAMQHRVDASWADAVKLLGFNIRAIPDTPNSGWLELDLYWQCLASVETDYVIGIRLVDARGQVILAQDGQPDGGQAPTSRWKPGEIVHDFRSLRYDGLAMGETYHLEIVLTAPVTGQTILPEKDGKTIDPLVLTSWP